MMDGSSHSNMERLRIETSLERALVEDWCSFDGEIVAGLVDI